MTRATITETDVFAAAHDLVAQGEQPTTLRLHKALGRGSYSTITKHLKAWEQSEEALEARADRLPKQAEVPQELLDEATAYVKKAWFAAKGQADATLNIERQALEDAKQQYAQELEEAINLADAATQAQEQAEERSAALTEQLAQTQAQIEALTRQLADAQQDAEAQRTAAETARQEAQLQRDAAVAERAKNEQLQERVQDFKTILDNFRAAEK